MRCDGECNDLLAGMIVVSVDISLNISKPLLI